MILMAWFWPFPVRFGSLLLGPVRRNSAAGPGGRISRRLAWRTNSRYGEIELDPIWKDERQRRTYGNGERYFYVSYGVLTEFLRMNVILTYFCNGDTDTELWKSGIRIWFSCLVGKLLCTRICATCWPSFTKRLVLLQLFRTPEVNKRSLPVWFICVLSFNVIILWWFFSVAYTSYWFWL